MKYHADKTKMWDAWFLNIDGTVHAFHLQMPLQDSDLPFAEAWSIGHAISSDLIHWIQCPNILPPLQDERDPKDFGSKFTGCAIEKDGKYYLYYTMRDKVNYDQRIGVAISEDAYNWTRYPKNPVIEPDTDKFIGYGPRDPEWGIVDCRDFVVIRNPADGLYYGYFVAAAMIGRMSPVGAIVAAVSDDLLNWKNQTIVYVPRSNGMIEVPDVYYMNGKWYLTVLTGNHYCGRAGTYDEYINNYTLFAVADHPLGPFTEPDRNVFIGGIANSGFTCRTVEKDGKRYVLYVDRPAGIETLSLPKEVHVDSEDRPGPYYAEILTNLRTDTIIGRDHLPELTERPANSFAWKTYGGIFTKENNKIIAVTEPFSWQAEGFGTGAHNIEFNADVTLKGAVSAGLWISCRTGEKRIDNLFLLEPENGRVILTKFYDFSNYAARKYEFNQNTCYQIKLILIDGVCELYVNNHLLLQCGIEMLETSNAGFFCDRGTAEFENISLYALEE